MYTKLVHSIKLKEFFLVEIDFNIFIYSLDINLVFKWFQSVYNNFYAHVLLRVFYRKVET